MSSDKKLLVTQDLSVGYTSRGSTAFLFQNLNVALRGGELVCFMGPNGAGKSTLIRTLAGLQPQLSGHINFFQSTSSKAESHISVVLTDRVTAQPMTVYDLVSYGRYPYLNWAANLKPSDIEIIDQSIAQVRIQHLSEKKIYELSDGQMQMAMIARALAQDTPVVLLDEPTSHLDLNNRVEVMNLLRKISRTSGKAILVATHELDLALQTADLIWLATADKKIKSGVPEDLILDGSLDRVFQFKGYDLKTGKIDQDAHRGISVQLQGEGPEYLWTKNALERSGFNVAPSGKLVVTISHEQGLSWLVPGREPFTTLAALLDALTGN